MGMPDGHQMSSADREQWRRVKGILATAIEQGPGERDVYLDRVCGEDSALRVEVESLLVAHDGADFTAGTPEGWLATLDLSPGSTLGPYRIVEKLGEGGMGQVFAARQETPVRRTVALKLIRPGMDSQGAVLRFAAERQTLALMAHPNIAQVFDAGSSESGRLYFAMEVVEGHSITDHCNAFELSCTERIELFLQVCRGVQHAHQKGVIHRDLKPSNVLVATIDGQPVPKIIDFGIAKVMQGQLHDSVPNTEHDRLMGTPEYMSPEQTDPRGLAVDTRTDVYSLGALLYELLTGSPPFDRRTLRRLGLEDLRQHLREVEPPRPSCVRQPGSSVSHRTAIDPSVLVGDLDWIVMRALDKDPNQRYESPAAMADDLERHLRNQPVAAGPPTLRYRLGKFVRRHRVGVGVALIVASTAISGFGLAILGLTRAVRSERATQAQAAIARTEADRASREAETAQQISTFLLSLFTSSNPRMSQRPAMTLREVLDMGAVRIRQDLGDRPVVQSRMMQTMGQAYHAIGLYAEARDLYEEALHLRIQEEGELSLGVSEILHNLGWLLLDLGEHDACRPIIERSIAIKEQILGPDHPRVAASLHNLAILYQRVADYEGARHLFERALRIRETEHGPEHSDVARTLASLGLLLAFTGDFETATTHLRRALAIEERTRGTDHPELAFILSNLAEVRLEEGDLRQAREYAQRAFELDLAAYGPDHQYVALSLLVLGSIERESGAYETARAHLTRAMAVVETTLHPGHLRMAQALEEMAALDRAEGAMARADRHYRQALVILEDVYGPDHPEVADVLVPLAEMALEAGDRDTARRLYTRALDIRADRLEPDNPELVDVRLALAELGELGE